MKPVKLITSILTLAAAITVSSFGWVTAASAADNESLKKQNSDAVKTYIVNPYDDMEKLQELKDATVTMKFKAGLCTRSRIRDKHNQPLYLDIF